MIPKVDISVYFCGPWYLPSFGENQVRFSRMLYDHTYAYA